MSERAERYKRIAEQLAELFRKTTDPTARMATAAALLSGKMKHHFWVGFYRLVDGDLVVGPYQGPLACALLPRHEGVCWAAIDRNEPVLVPDVHEFPGHVACDSRSQSEVVVPVHDGSGQVIAVLDVDSDKPNAFDQSDVKGLQAIAALIGKGCF
ncbi:MAG: GAF domain-containing protein [Acidobacteriota bacterium]